MDILHSAFIFRFVIGFAMACPFLIIPAAVSLFKKRPKVENTTETRDGQGPRIVVSAHGTQRKQADRQPKGFAPDSAVASPPRRAA
jgi:hypothetical protein